MVGILFQIASTKVVGELLIVFVLEINEVTTGYVLGELTTANKKRYIQ